MVNLAQGLVLWWSVHYEALTEIYVNIWLRLRSCVPSKTTSSKLVLLLPYGNQQLGYLYLAFDVL